MPSFDVHGGAGRVDAGDRTTWRVDVAKNTNTEARRNRSEAQQGNRRVQTDGRKERRTEKEQEHGNERRERVRSTEHQTGKRREEHGTSDGSHGRRLPRRVEIPPRCGSGNVPTHPKGKRKTMVRTKTNETRTLSHAQGHATAAIPNRSARENGRG
eukprot:scaffold148_cov341-Pavlova_lutheri.AAC.18